MDEIELKLKQAYKKLKSYLYSDKTLLQEKIDLSFFEENLENNLKELAKNIKKENISDYLKSISYTLVPKKIKKEQPKHSSSIYTNKTKEDKYIVESKNIFIKAPIEIHLIATLWIMEIGEKLDKNLIENVKGNRLFRDKNGFFQNDSYKLFHPYFEGYQSFRDEAIDMATHLHNKNLDVTVLNIDIQEFYYNIEFSFKDLEQDEYGLNNLMQQIHDKYHKKIKDLSPREKDNNEDKYNQKNFLPIGLVSSAVIANYVLSKFDKEIVENLKPEYYSRYVDDMLFVFSNANIDSKDIVTDLLSSKTKIVENKTIKIETKKEAIEIIVDNQKFKLQNKKVKLFQFYKNDSISLLEKFKENIEENSSFFNFMPDDKKLFKTLESSSYDMFYSDSENKLSSIVGTTKDTLSISRNLSGALATVSSAKFDKEHLAIYNKQLKNVFSGRNIFELRLHWEKVFTYLYITKEYELFVEFYKDFYNSINKLSCNKLSEHTISFLNNCILFVVSINPSDFENIIIKKLSENNIEIDQAINTSFIDNIRNSNMFSSYLMTYSLLNYLDFLDNDGFAIKKDFNFLTNNIDTNSLKYKINQKKIEHSPRFIHYHEIILFNFY